MDDDLIRAGEAAAMFGVSANRLAELYAQGRPLVIPALILPSGQARYRRSDVEAAVKELQPSPQQEAVNEFGQQV